MSSNYNIGQCRRSQFDSFEENISYIESVIEDSYSLSNTIEVIFEDPCLFINLTPLTSYNSYYLNFSVVQTTDAQTFKIKLINTDIGVSSLFGDEEVQTIRTFTVPKGNSKSYFELIFTPNTSYNMLLFELVRTAEDFTYTNSSGGTGRFIDITILDFSLVKNLITSLSNSYNNLTALSKIGIQGPPGLVFVLNGEEFHLGKSGTFELYSENIKITYVGFIIKESSFTQDGKDFFIMDFKY